jgi:protein SCO1/2
MARNWRCVIISALALSTLLCSCANGSSGDSAGTATASSRSTVTGRYSGDVLTNPIALPAVTLTDQGGGSFDLHANTAGKLVLLFIGYTHCPDECPTTMADIAVAIHRLTPAQQARIDVVFITSDPERDTPAQLKNWLGYFNPSFIGLTGSYSTIARTAKGIGIPIEPPVKNADGSVTVPHGTELLVFSADRRATLLYSLGFKAAALAHDLVQLEEIA